MTGASRQSTAPPMPQGHSRRVHEFLARLDLIIASGASEFGGPNSVMLEPDFALVVQAAQDAHLTRSDFYALDTRPGAYAFGGYPASFWKLRQTRNRCGHRLFAALRD